MDSLGINEITSQLHVKDALNIFKNLNKKK